MSAEENKALACRLIEETFNEGNLDVVDDPVAPDYVNHEPTMPEDIRGPEGFKEFVATYRSGRREVSKKISP